MPTPTTGAITFISYVAADGPRKDYELQVSTIRSHNARQAHSERRSRRGQDGPPADARKARKCSETKASRGDPQHDTRRTVDWFFGNIGGSCRPVGNIDVAAINYYLNRSLELNIGTGLLAKYKQSSLPPLMSPLSRNVVQRAMSELPVLNSLLASVAFMMAEEYSSNDSLVAFGHSTVQEAIRNLRSWLPTADWKQPLSVLSCVVSLCLAALTSGDLDAALAHLSFIMASSQTLDPSDPHHARLLWVMRGCKIRYALETGNTILNSTIEMPDPPIAIPGGSATISVSPHSLERPMAATPPPPFRNLKVLYGSEETICESDLGANVDLNDDVKLRSHAGFFQAIAIGVISPNWSGILENYVALIDLLYGLGHKAEIQAASLLNSIDKCYGCLDETCFQWYAVQQKGAAEASKTNNASIIDSGIMLNKPIHLAIQIRLVFSSGPFLAPTLPNLSKRLLACLIEDEHLVVGAAKLAEGPAQRLPRRLVLWILIAGLTASSKIPQVFEWYWYQATNIARMLHIETESQMLTALAPFNPIQMPPNDGFLLAAKSLLGHDLRKEVASPSFDGLRKDLYSPSASKTPPFVSQPVSQVEEHRGSRWQGLKKASFDDASIPSWHRRRYKEREMGRR